MSDLGNLARSRPRYDAQLWNVSILPAEHTPLESLEGIVASDDKAQKSRREAKAQS